MSAGAPVASLLSFARVEGERRFDPAASNDGARCCFVLGGRCLLWSESRQPVLLASESVRGDGDVVFLGNDDCGRMLFMFEWPFGFGEDTSLEALGLVTGDALFAEPMLELGRYNAGTRELIVTVLALAHWSAENRHCGICGAALRWDGRTKLCTGPGEPHRHFPRLDPATIMLVHDGDRVLLGRQKAWPSGLYSTLAGFVEPGETLEATVVREVYEEAGIRVDDVRYFASEAWPFPRSLMLGFFARARDFEIRAGDELEDVRWFARDEVRALQERLSVRMPHFDAIARRLMFAWLDRA